MRQVYCNYLYLLNLGVLLVLNLLININVDVINFFSFDHIYQNKDFMSQPFLIAVTLFVLFIGLLMYGLEKLIYVKYKWKIFINNYGNYQLFPERLADCQESHFDPITLFLIKCKEISLPLLHPISWSPLNLCRLCTQFPNIDSFLNCGRIWRVFAFQISQILILSNLLRFLLLVLSQHSNRTIPRVKRLLRSINLSNQDSISCLWFFYAPQIF